MEPGCGDRFGIFSDIFQPSRSQESSLLSSIEHDSQHIPLDILAYYSSVCDFMWSK